MATAERIVTEDRRLAILANLLPKPGYRLPIITLKGVLLDAGYVVGTDRLMADCAWLDEMDCLVWDGETAKLTQTGVDAATGTVRIPGIGRPGPSV